MGYGKYGMKLNVQNMSTPITDDPWYNLGALIGTAWGKNYNDRGVEKTAAAGNEALENAKKAMGEYDYDSLNKTLDNISSNYLICQP